MSIADNAVELEEARLRVGAEDESKLVEDLAYWSVVELDHHADMVAIQERMSVAYGLHAEARQWGAVIAAELRKRRDEKRRKADG